MFYMKCIKKEGELCFWEDKESILFLSKISLQRIVGEVVYLFEDNVDIYESILIFQGNKKFCLDNVSRIFLIEKDIVVF